MIYLIEYPGWEYIAFVNQLDAIEYLESLGYKPDTSPEVKECITLFGPDVLHYKTVDGERLRITPVKLIGDQQ